MYFCTSGLSTLCVGHYLYTHYKCVKFKCFKSLLQVQITWMKTWHIYVYFKINGEVQTTCNLTNHDHSQSNMVDIYPSCDSMLL